MAYCRGEKRLTDILIDQIELRPVCLDDAQQIFMWRNDPRIVMRGSSQREIPWEEHITWLKHSLNEQEENLLFIVKYIKTSIGLVRFTRKLDDTAEISAYIVDEYTAKGIGTRAICIGCSTAFIKWPVRSIVACIRNDNPGGCRAFSKAGFVVVKTDRCPAGHTAFVLYK